MVRVKICGITNIEDARHAADAGCDALGFVFYKKSSRYISPDKARRIIREIPRRVLKIGVFVDETEKNIRRIAKSCGIKILQFHGHESPAFCDRFKGYKVIKAFRIKKAQDLKGIARFKTFAFLFDAYAKQRFGGTGKRFNWKLVRHLDGLRQPVFLSGGLNAGNVSKAIEAVRPAWVDASSSLESRPGIKDPGKVKEFIRTVKMRKVRT